MAKPKPSKRLYDELPVCVTRFVTEAEYLGLAGEVYPRVVTTLKEIFGGKHQEAVLCWGIGSGKSFLCSLALLYMVYRTLCLRDPQKHYGLAAGSPIHIVNVGPTARVAEKVIFGQMRAMAARSPWFANKYPPDARTRSELRFAKQVEVLPGNSSELFPLGLNVLGATMDEAAYFVETQNGDQEAAEEVYLALLRRIQSRFGEQGLLLLASSPRHGEDFIMRKLAEAETDPRIYGSHKATWEVKPRKGRKMCEAGGMMVPAEMAAAFRRNPQKARRDYGAVPGAAYQPFFGDMEALEAAAYPAALRAAPLPGDPPGLLGEGDDKRQPTPPRSARHPSPQGRGNGDGNDYGDGGPPPAPSPRGRGNGDGDDNGSAGWASAGSASREAGAPTARHGRALRHPLTEEGRLEEWFRPGDRAERFIHVDLGVKKDACGIAMAKIVCEDGQPVAVVEMMHRIVAPQNGEVSLAAVRELIYALRRRGFPIAQVSYDGWQSIDSQQILRQKGFRVAIVSVDRGLEAYETLKEMANEGRLRIYRFDRFLDECRRLELTRADKVDHPKKGSKDVADAVAGAVSEAMKAWSGVGVRGRIV
ncbi:MAG: hypothetical protein KKI08_10905 [Armatimonadetes bacterium]|nr:hypothetical protein [Armatimonadota bacterium]